MCYVFLLDRFVAVTAGVEAQRFPLDWRQGTPCLRDVVSGLFLTLLVGWAIGMSITDTTVQTAYTAYHKM